MGIHGRPQPLVFIALVRAPALPIGDKEALLRRQPVQRFELLILRVFLPCQIGQERSAEVRQILAVGQFAVDLDVVDDGVSGILIDHALGTLLKLLAVGIRPPVA